MINKISEWYVTTKPGERARQRRQKNAQLTDFMDAEPPRVPRHKLKFSDRSKNTAAQSDLHGRKVLLTGNGCGATTGEHIMDTNPDLTELEGKLVEHPANTVVDGKVTGVVKGTRAEIFNMDDGETPKYGDRDDVMLQVEVNVEHEGETFSVTDFYTVHDSITTRSDLGKYMKRYGGAPFVGDTVSVSFDADGDGSIVLG